MRARSALVPVVALSSMLLVGCATGGSAGGAGAEREAFGTGSALFSNAVRAGNLIFTSGVIGRPSNGGGIQSATRQALGGVQDRVEAAGATMADVVKCTVFMVDMEDYGGMNEAYVEFFPSSPPARTAIAVRELPASAQVEIECVAVIP